jgi:glycosyltransferase involved in cell wall biosynthesis
MSQAPRSVLMVTPLWGRNGGVAAHVETSAQLLAAQGLRVGVLAARVDASAPPNGIALYHCPALFDRHAPPDARLGDAPVFAPDVVHLHQVDDPEVLGRLRRHAPVAISAHAYSACTAGVHYFKPGQECTRAHGPGCVVGLAARNCAHIRNPRPLPAGYRQTTRALAALRGADLAISYSSAVDRHLATNGVARRAVVPLFTTLTPQPGAHDADSHRVLFAGRIVKPKGLDVLLRAARGLDAELVVCGDGLQLDAMRRLARRLGLAERVDFRGWLGAEQLAAELARAAVVAVPSLWPEPFGLIGIEALAAGRPVVGSATGGMRDWLHDGRTGLAVRPGDPAALARALSGLLADPARRRELGAAGRELVAARFSPARHVAALLKSYRAARSNWESAPR